MSVCFGKNFFQVLLYPEDIEITDFISACEIRGLNYVGILHNNSEDIQQGKPHYHFVIYSESFSRQTLESFCKCLNLAIRFIRKIDKPCEAIQYLTHESASAINEGKYVYPRYCLISNLTDEIIELFYSGAYNPTQFVIDDLYSVARGALSFSEFMLKHPEQFNKCSNVSSFLNLISRYK